MKTLDWYFDFLSPFAYLSLGRVEQLSAKIDIRYRPVLFAGLLQHWGNKGPAELAPKRLWTYRWCTWRAARDGIAFRFPSAHPFNPLPYLRLSSRLAIHRPQCAQSSMRFGRPESIRPMKAGRYASPKPSVSIPP